MESITLKGEDVTAKLLITAAPLQYKKGPREGEDYHIGRHNGKGFTCEPEFFNEWSKGNVHAVTLTPSTYEVIDPQNPDKPITRESWTLDGYMTENQYSNYMANRKKNRQLEVDVDMIELKAKKDLKLDDATIAALQEA